MATISGNLGVSGWGVVLSGAASASTTTDASGNYSFTALGNGSYVVTPSVPTGGVTSFTPANSPVTISGGANQTGVNYTYIGSLSGQGGNSSKDFKPTFPSLTAVPPDGPNINILTCGLEATGIGAFMKAVIIRIAGNAGDVTVNLDRPMQYEGAYEQTPGGSRYTLGQPSLDVETTRTLTIPINVLSAALQSVGVLDKKTFDLVFGAAVDAGTPTLASPVTAITQQAPATLRVALDEAQVASVASADKHHVDVAFDRAVTVGSPSVSTPVSGVTQQAADTMRVALDNTQITAVTSVDKQTVNVTFDRNVDPVGLSVSSPVTAVTPLAATQVRVSLDAPHITGTAAVDGDHADVTFDRPVVLDSFPAADPIASYAKPSTTTLRIGVERPTINVLSVAASGPNTIRVTFGATVQLTDLGESPLGYVITGLTPVFAVSAVMAGPDTLIIRTTEQITGVSHTLKLKEGIVTSLNELTNADYETTFTGQGTPIIQPAPPEPSAAAISATLTIRNQSALPITFDELGVVSMAPGGVFTTYKLEQRAAVEKLVASGSFQATQFSDHVTYVNLSSAALPLSVLNVKLHPQDSITVVIPANRLALDAAIGAGVIVGI